MIERPGITLPRQPQPEQPAVEQRQLQVSRDVIFFWAMAPIAAKYIARRRPMAAFDLLRSAAGALGRVEQALSAGPDRFAERAERCLTTAGDVQLRVLREMCDEMAALLPRLVPLQPEAGSVSPDAPAQLLRFVDRVQHLRARR